MNTKYKKLIILLLFALALLPLRTASADTGPKPTMDFTFEQGIPGQQLTIVSGALFECQQSDCSDAKPLGQMGPQHFSCGDTTCHALAYGFSPYHRLDIQFSDGKTRVSNIFQTAGFESIYTVTIRSHDLLVEAQFNPNNLLPTTFLPFDVILVCGCLLCLIVVVVIVVVVLIARRKSKQP
ncbi:MAG: hypothetical protein M1282_11545 [Chloroflexi bacterium]|nr:hypothetical protein [Chloroflexota bacterium]